MSAAAAGSTALTVNGCYHSVALPEGVYDVNGQQLDTRRENSVSNRHSLQMPAYTNTIRLVLTNSIVHKHKQGTSKGIA